jgi:hypothetical protein
MPRLAYCGITHSGFQAISHKCLSGVLKATGVTTPESVLGGFCNRRSRTLGLCHDLIDLKSGRHIVPKRKGGANGDDGKFG